MLDFQTQVRFFKPTIYDVAIGRNCYAEFVDRLEAFQPLDTVMIVTDSHVNDLYAEELESVLRAADYRVLKHVLTPTRKSKSLESVEQICGALFEAGAERSSIIINLGGGVVGDTGGLAAALYMRGIRFIHMPTTLLSQVDSSIGGKVGVNLGGRLNGLGSFYHPSAVWIDLDVLKTLPNEEYLSGMAEIIKYAVVLDKPLFENLEAYADLIAARDDGYLEEVIRYTVAKKVEIVSCDPGENQAFNLFTYGHEIGHAIEVALDYQHLRHGEAVAIGMEGAMWLSAQAGVLENAALMERQSDLLVRVGLPRSVPAAIRDAGLSERIYNAIHSDKKRSSGKMTWILPLDVGKAMAVNTIDDAMVRECLHAVVVKT